MANLNLQEIVLVSLINNERFEVINTAIDKLGYGNLDVIYRQSLLVKNLNTKKKYALVLDELEKLYVAMILSGLTLAVLDPTTNHYEIIDEFMNENLED